MKTKTQFKIVIAVTGLFLTIGFQMQSPEIHKAFKMPKKPIAQVQTQILPQITIQP